MSKRIVMVMVTFLVAYVALPAFSFGQQTKVDAALESIRADARADKVAIVTEAMRLSPAEGEKFWPVYREYDSEVIKLNDKRIAIFTEYATKFATMTDAEAAAIAESVFAWEASRTELRKTYFKKFAKATSAMTAAKFFQIERRLDLIVDLQLASEIPGLFIKTSTSAK